MIRIGVKSMVEAALGAASLIGKLFGGGSKATTTQKTDMTTTGSSTIDSTKNDQQNSTQDTTANTAQLDSATLKQLTDLVSGNLSSASLSSDARQQQLGMVLKGSQNPFDVSKYVAGITGAASDTINQGMNQNINTLESNIGGSSSGNSMASLLAAKERTSAASQLAGITEQATASGQQILDAQTSANTSDVATLTSGQDSQLTALLTALKGSNTNQTQNVTAASTDVTTQHQQQDTTQHQVGTGTATTTQPFNFLSNLGSLGNAAKTTS